MYFSINPSKDTTISNATINGVSKTGSNSGQSEIVELYYLTASANERGMSRILMHFDLSELSSSISSGLIPSSSVEYRLRLKNSNHYETLPSSYSIQVVPLSRSFHEGAGLAMYDEDLKDAGYANWIHATSAVQWTSEGGDFVPALSASQDFDLGDEDFNVDVSNIVYAWLTGGVPNNGFALKFETESGATDLYVKKFYSRHALRQDRRPRLEALWARTTQDDRENIKYNRSGSLAYYLFPFGEGETSPSQMFVQILNSGSTAVQVLTASQPEPGVFVVSGVAIQPTGSTQIFRDVWFSGAQQFFTGTVVPVYETGSIKLDYGDIDILLPNLKTEYTIGTRMKVHVFAKAKDYKPAIQKSGSVALKPLFLKDAYYEIRNANNNEIVVPFSTGSNKFSKLSYDKDGNYFTFWTDNSASESVYKIRILTNINNQKLIFDNGWTFKTIKG